MESKSIKKAASNQRSASKQKSKSKSRQSKAKVENTEGMPPKAIGPYIFYSNDMVPKIKAEEGLDHREAMKKAGERWHDLTEEEKAPYEQLHQ